MGHNKGDHDCRYNYDGSSKGMEASIAVELYTKNPLFIKHHVFGARLIMNNDSATIASLRAVSNHNIELWADKNHSVKAFSNSMYGMSLPKPVIDYFTNTLSNVIAKHKNRPQDLAHTLRSIVPHAFGDHTQCTFHEEKENYVYSKVPGKKPLEGESLRMSLEELMGRYVNNVDKLAPAASTQINENCNNIVASKCPKSKHYSGSEALNYRVAAAVCQKTLGHTYIDEIFKKIGISPTHKGLKFRKIKQEKVIKKRLLASSRDGKIRRRFLKTKKSSKNSSVQRNEGLSYQSDIGLTGILDIPIDNVELSFSGPANNEIEIKQLVIVYFDLETTGLSTSDQIVQIAAYDGNTTFNIYSLPTVPIKPKATEKTGLTTKKGQLFLRGNKLDTVSKEAAIRSFLKYLEEIQIRHSILEPCRILLVGHNVLSFDAVKIKSIAHQFGLYEKFSDLVYGYTDTLRLIKKKIPKPNGERMSYSEENLVKKYLPQENIQSLHDALQDILVLQKLLHTLGITEDQIKKECTSIRKIESDKMKKLIVEQNKASLQFLKNNMKPRMITKMAKEGINKKILIDAYRKDSINEIKVLLSMSVNCKIRVTSSTDIINIINDRIKNQCDV
ncbi:uncharacterized protein [Prorops nasuta]|uniref:uncharacterized protein n=1 Tax=Prorops nasuta TaxID=863751 RepID=UPI0034CE6FD6